MSARIPTQHYVYLQCIYLYTLMGCFLSLTTCVNDNNNSNNTTLWHHGPLFLIDRHMTVRSVHSRRVVLTLRRVLYQVLGRIAYVSDTGCRRERTSNQGPTSAIPRPYHSLLSLRPSIRPPTSISPNV